MVRTVDQNKVKKFDEDVSSVAQDTTKKGLLRLNDMDIEIIYSSTLQIKAYFNLLQTICRMYMVMHVAHVEPGLNLVFELSKGVQNQSQMREKREALDAFTDKAQKEIMKTVDSKQQEIRDSLQDRVNDISEQSQMLEQAGLPPVDLAFMAAMKTGSETISEHVEKSQRSGLEMKVSEDIRI